MSGNLPAVAKAMILASLPLCALLAGCGGGSDDVFEGVPDEDLAAFGITVVDRHPDPSPAHFASEEALTYVDEVTGGADVVDSQLLRVAVSQVPPGLGEHLVWAVRIDPDTVQPLDARTPGVGGPVYVIDDEGVDVAILFLDAQSGQLVANYQGKSGDSRVADASPMEVNTDALLGDIRPLLDEAHIMILDSEPDEEPALSLAEASEILNDHGARVTRGALLRMDSYTDTLYLDPATYPEVLAWALEMDLTAYDDKGIFGDESSSAIVFLSANDGTFVTMWER